MLRTQNNLNEVEDLLESDDELPDEYTEDPETPAYKNDSRFDIINFSWVTNPTKTCNGNSKELSKTGLPIKLSLFSILNEDTVYGKTKTLKHGEKILIHKGVLSHQDIYCLKCVESCTNDAVLLWLVNFFIYKDMQSDFKYLKSCLVCDSVFNAEDNKVNKKIYMKRHNFEIKILNK